MPDNDNKIIPFKSREPLSLDHEKKTKKEALLSQIESTIKESRKASLHEHALYYISVFFGLSAIFFALIMIMLQKGIL